jgi:hypothetical protein
MPEIHRITGENLVAAVAAERDRDVLFDESRQQKRRNQRTVRHRFVEPRSDFRNQIRRPLDAQFIFVMFGSEMRRDLPAYFDSSNESSSKPMENVFTFSVENCVANAATVEESTPPLNKIPSGTSETSRIRPHRRAVRAIVRRFFNRRRVAVFVKTQIPVTARFYFAVFQNQKMRGGQFVNVFVNRSGRGNVIERKILPQRVNVLFPL